jgi:hypothetical protein
MMKAKIKMIQRNCNLYFIYLLNFRMDKIIKRGKMFEGTDNATNNSGKPVEFEKSKEVYGLNEKYKKKEK